MEQKDLAERKQWLAKRLENLKRAGKHGKAHRVHNRLNKLNAKIQWMSTQPPIQLLSAEVYRRFAKLQQRQVWAAKNLSNTAGNKSSVDLAKKFFTVAIRRFEFKLQKVMKKVHKIQSKLQSKKHRMSRKKVMELNQKLKRKYMMVQKLNKLMGRMGEKLNFISTHTPEETLQKFVEMKKEKFGDMKEFLTGVSQKKGLNPKRAKKVMRKLQMVNKKLGMMQKFTPEEFLRRVMVKRF